MTQQTHPSTQHDGDDREPQWYHGPASSSSAASTSGAGRDGDTDTTTGTPTGTTADAGRESAFGLGATPSSERDSSSDTQVVSRPTGELPLTWSGYSGSSTGTQPAGSTGQAAPGTSTGTARRPACCAARHRRSPMTSS